MISLEDVKCFNDRGFLVARNFLSREEVEDLQKWSQEVYGWKASEDSEFMPYEVRNSIKKEDII
jgi:hypothetical protein